VNPSTKSAFPPLRPQIDPVIAQKNAATQKLATTPSSPPKFSSLDRMQKELVGKWFYCVFASGDGWRAGKIESILDQGHFIARYFGKQNGKLLRFTHILRYYENPSVETLSGFWLFDTEEDLKAEYGFLQQHLRERSEKTKNAAANAGAPE
jgi:hypothetical protein